MSKKLREAYHDINPDEFPTTMELTLGSGLQKQTLFFERVEWTIDGVKKGLRYGENPDQPAALYKLVNGNVVIGGVHNISPGNYLASDIELLQSGKHPGKTNITDIDNALNILRYFSDTPCAVIVKHNNPCGVSKSDTLVDAYIRAYSADRIAAFGGAIAVNRAVDKATAEAIAGSYSEVIAAPEYEESAIGILQQRKNLRIMKIANIDHLHRYKTQRCIDIRSLMDGGMIIQWSYLSSVLKKEDLSIATTVHEGKPYSIKRIPTEQEYQDLLFGWLVESGITSNSVIYVKNETTVGIGTGEQDRVGVAEIARNKAYSKLQEMLSWQRYNMSFTQLSDEHKRREILEETEERRGGLKGSAMVSDAFFPFRDGVDVGLREGVTSVIQPGGSLRDFEVIEACNEYQAAMVFTGQRSFKH